MESTEVIALVGAAAWLPQIATWIYHSTNKPHVRLISDKQAGVGFTRYGPIFNMRMAFAVERKDAILDGISVELVHESGAKHRLDWFGTHETMSQIVGPSGLRQSVERESPPIALKLSTLALQEKFVRFQETVFHNGLRPLDNSFISHLNYLKTRSEKFLEDAFDSKEANALLDYYRQSFWWKAGVYTVRFGVSSPSRIVLKARDYSFSLTQSDVDGLSSNAAFIKKDIEDSLLIGTPGYQYQPTPWNWRNVTLTPAASLVRSPR